MEATTRTLVILLSMHRSGSSLTASVLQRLGLSLGPFELIGASPCNPHGHFEAMPVYELNRRVQERFHEFPDDIPLNQDGLRHFVATQGAWDSTQAIPREWLTEGRHLVASLLESGIVSGFKDPRTILAWPFWRLVFEAFPEVRVVPVVLLRSPHEIAMSLCTRSEGEYGYLACLDVVAVHLRRLRAVVNEWEAPVPIVRFGTGEYLSDLAGAARVCGLAWDATVARAHIDETCIHHTPATVVHEAQSIYHVLAGPPAESIDISTNWERLTTDERAREALVGRRLARYASLLNDLDRQLQQAGVQLEAAAAETCEIRAQALEQLQAVQEQLVLSRAEADELHRRLEQFETHRLLGPVLRSRRRLKMMFASLQSRLAVHLTRRRVLPNPGLRVLPDVPINPRL